MPKYNVHIFTVVRVKIRNIEAPSYKAAAKKADEQTDFHQLFSGTNPEIEWGEEHSHALVDILNANGEVDYQNSRWLAKDLKSPLKE